MEELSTTRVNQVAETITTNTWEDTLLAQTKPPSEGELLKEEQQYNDYLRAFEDTKNQVRKARLAFNDKWYPELRIQSQSYKNGGTGRLVNFTEITSENINDLEDEAITKLKNEELISKVDDGFWSFWNRGPQKYEIKKLQPRVLNTAEELEKEKEKKILDQEEVVFKITEKTHNLVIDRIQDERTWRKVALGLRERSTKRTKEVEKFKNFLALPVGPGVTVGYAISALELGPSEIPAVEGDGNSHTRLLEGQVMQTFTPIKGASSVLAIGYKHTKKINETPTDGRDDGPRSLLEIQYDPVEIHYENGATEYRFYVLKSPLRDNVGEGRMSFLNYKLSVKIKDGILVDVKVPDTKL